MELTIDKKTLKDFNKSSQLEWLETNGLGGYASGTVAGVNTRKYHGLLVSALRPPVDRAVLLARLEETIVLPNGNRHELFTNQFPNTLNPQGFQHLSNFEKGLFPKFTFTVGGVEIEKTIAMVYGEDTVVITYEVKAASKEFYMDLRPFIAYRDFHSIIHTNDSVKWDYKFDKGTLKLNPYELMPQLEIAVPESKFTHFPGWYHDFEYLREMERGQEFREDLFSYGYFSVKLKAGSKLGIVVSTQSVEGRDAFALLKKEEERRNTLIKAASVKKDPFIAQLVLAADQFIVKRGEDLRSVIAGYPWFSDWGRDTMISLPGLCLVTGRFEEAKKILKAFAGVVDKGMIPNRFPDKGDQPDYNTVDATLWYFVAIYKYFKYTKDKEFIITELLPVLQDIIQWHENVTRYHIHETEDGLIWSGYNGHQLTWMDAKVGNWVVTPRTGKPVEINALWYNVLKITAEFQKLAGNKKEAARLEEKSEKTLASFREQFWSKEKKYLYDYLGDHINDDALRPNQIIALSLPFTLLEEKQAKAVLKAVEQSLLTPYGLRTLEQNDPYYRGHYGGNQWSRDGAYHQGTAWSWLLGPYYTAKVRLEGAEGKEKVLKHIDKFKVHLSEAGVGSISEIFDGEKPFLPNGCIAQAWGVAEVLRAYVEDCK